MNKLGPHIQRLTPDVLDWIELAKPPLVVWIDPNQDGVDEIRQRSPATFIVGRRYEGGQSWQANAIKQTVKRLVFDAVFKTEIALTVKRSTDRMVALRRKTVNIAARIVNALKARGWDLWAAAVSPESWADQCAAMAKCDAYICWNEPFGHDHKHLFQPFDQWQCRFRERLLEHGLEAVAFNFGTGNFTKDGPDIKECFPKTCATFRYFGIHEYYWPIMREAVGYYCLRFPFWHKDIGRDDVFFIVTECGMTQMVHEGRPDEGWRTYADGVTDESYLAELDWYNGQLCQYSYVKGAALFNWGGYGWETFEHGDHPIRSWIAELDAPGPPPPDDNGGDDMDIRVVDLQYKERDFEYVKQKYGVAFRRAKVQPGQKVYRLVELWEKTGHSSLVTQVLNEDGQPMANVDVAFYWPDAPEQPANANDWYKKFVHGPTNENGEVGPGMGPGAYHGEGEGGPHAVWVRDPDIPSDICEKLGMLAGTNHDHLDQKFRLEVHQGEEPSPPPDGEDKWVEVEDGRAFQAQGNNRIVIVAQGERDFYDTRASIGVKRLVIDGEWRESDWEAGPFHPESLTKYVLTADYTPDEGEQSRVFWVTIEDCEGKVIGGPFEFEFYTDEHGWWTTLVEWRKAEPPHPPPQPQGDVKAVAQAVATWARDVAAMFALFAAEMDGLAGEEL